MNAQRTKHPSWDELHSFGCGAVHPDKARQEELQTHIRSCEQCKMEVGTVHTAFTKLLSKLSRYKVAEESNKRFNKFMGMS